jgi:biotin transport system substrate-specific component
MKKTLPNNFVQKIILIYSNSKFVKFIFCLTLSLFFALCSQIIIPLPFNFVPISLQPLPLFLLSLLIGWPAVYAYLLTIFQTALGAPFFSGFQGGMVKLLGPTGGYIFGFAVAMIFLTIVRNYNPSPHGRHSLGDGGRWLRITSKKNSLPFLFLKLLCANIIVFTFGLLQLCLFVPYQKLFTLGLYPFIFGDMLKTIIIMFIIHNIKR